MHKIIEGKDDFQHISANTLPAPLEAAIRQIIIQGMEEYAKSPTYVEVDWDDELQELDEKRLHSDWWDELDGVEDEAGWLETYCDQIAYQVRDLLNEHLKGSDDDPLDAAMEILSILLPEYTLDAEPLENLAEQYEQEMRQYVAQAPLEDVKGALVRWFRWWPKGICACQRGACATGERIVSRDAVCDRLEDCQDLIGKDLVGLCDGKALSTNATYSEAVAFVRRLVEAEK